MVRRILLAGAVTVVLAAVGASIAYRAAYGTFAWWSDPEQISWCGRDYLPTTGPLQPRSVVEQQRAGLAGEPSSTVVEVTRVPAWIGRPVLASVTSEATRQRLGVPCAMVLYLQTGPDEFRTYVISGGP